MRAALKRIYGRLIKLPVVGSLFAAPIRAIKRLFGNAETRRDERLDYVMSALDSLRGDVEVLKQALRAVDAERQGGLEGGLSDEPRR